MSLQASRKSVLWLEAFPHSKQNPWPPECDGLNSFSGDNAYCRKSHMNILTFSFQALAFNLLGLKVTSVLHHPFHDLCQRVEVGLWNACGDLLAKGLRERNGLCQEVTSGRRQGQQALAAVMCADRNRDEPGQVQLIDDFNHAGPGNTNQVGEVTLIGLFLLIDVVESHPGAAIQAHGCHDIVKFIGEQLTAAGRNAHDAAI